MITCKKFIGFLLDYYEGHLVPEEKMRFDGHLDTCPSCVAYLNTYEKTIRLGREALCEAEDGPPEDPPEDLVQAVLEARRSGSG